MTQHYDDPSPCYFKVAHGCLAIVRNYGRLVPGDFGLTYASRNGQTTTFDFNVVGLSPMMLSFARAVAECVAVVSDYSPLGDIGPVMKHIRPVFAFWTKVFTTLGEVEGLKSWRPLLDQGLALFFSSVGTVVNVLGEAWKSETMKAEDEGAGEVSAKLEWLFKSGDITDGTHKATVDSILEHPFAAKLYGLFKTLDIIRSNMETLGDELAASQKEFPKDATSKGLGDLRHFLMASLTSEAGRRPGACWET